MNGTAPSARARLWPARGDWAGWLLLAALALLGGLLLLKVIDTIQIMIGPFNWPFQSDESESMIVAETLLLDRGVNIFGPITPQQFIAAPYPPLYYLLNWPFIHVLGPTFKSGRAISLLATAGVGLGIYAITWRLTRDRLAGLFGALAWGAIGIVGFWGALVKPDMFAVACGLGGLWWVLRAAERGQGAVWWALPFFWAAFYSKQTAIAAAVAACVWLILRHWRTGLLFTGLYALGTAGGYLLLDLLTAGGFFYHEFTIHDLPWFAGRFVDTLTAWLETYWLLVGVGLLGVAAVFGRAAGALLREAGLGGLLRRAGRWDTLAAPQSGVLLLGYAGMGVFAAAGVATLGGNHNHLLDLTTAGCLGFALALALLRRAPGRVAPAVGALVVLGLCTQVPLLYDTPHWLGHELRVPPQSVREGMDNIAQYTSNTPGPVYSTNLSVLLATDKWRLNLWTTDPFTQTHATLLGRWDESALVQAIREGRFALIILDINLDNPTDAAGNLSPGLQAAIRAAYHLDQRNVLNLYKPNGAR
jgi:hypothetical protein